MVIPGVVEPRAAWGGLGKSPLVDAVPQHEDVVRRQQGHGGYSVAGPPPKMKVDVTQPSTDVLQDDEGVGRGKATKGR